MSALKRSSAQDKDTVSRREQSRWFSFLSFGADNVVLTAIKKAEDDGALIIRFYEWAGKAGDVRVRLPTGAESVAETDLMEKATANLPLEGGNIAVPTKPYEIRTVRIEYAGHHVNQELSHE